MEYGMQAKVIHDGAEKTYVLIFDTGDEVMTQLCAFAKTQHLAASHFTAIGAFSDAMLGYFEWERKAYKPIPLPEQVEVLSLVGDIAIQENGEPQVHAHVVLGKSDGTAHGGHLLQAHVRPTLELILSEAPTHLRRTPDPASGLALIRL
jgi:predicted DNA-binding protein with PD1-like motif